MATPNTAFSTLSDDVRTELENDIRMARKFLNNAELAIDADDEYPRLHPDGEPMTDNRGREMVSTNTTRDYYLKRAQTIWQEWITPAGPVKAPTRRKTPAAAK